MSPKFHYPALFLTPDFEEPTIMEGEFRLARRLWETPIFDLATLATKHTLHLPYQVMDVFLGRCNLEVSICGDLSLEEAFDRLQSLRLALYSEGVSPFIVPFATSYSINKYSGINSRDSEYLRSKLPEGMRDGLTSETGRVEAWPVELSFQCNILPHALNVTRITFERAVAKAKLWSAVCASQKTVQAFGRAVLAAPTIPSRSQSVLHLWCAIESLFPGVTTELSFRVALYMAQLVAPQGGRQEYFERVKKGYNVRSKIAHGAKQEATVEEWCETWQFVIDAYNAILDNRRLPVEDELIANLLS